MVVYEVYHLLNRMERVRGGLGPSRMDAYNDTATNLGKRYNDGKYKGKSLSGERRREGVCAFVLSYIKIFPPWAQNGWVLNLGAVICSLGRGCNLRSHGGWVPHNRIYHN